MEVWCEDDGAQKACKGKHSQVVALAHQHLGPASVVKVTSVSGGNALQLETASGSIMVGRDLRKVLV